MKRALRPLGILMAVLLVATVVFSGGALAWDFDVDQDADQDAETDQEQSSAAFNIAGVNAGCQYAVSEQVQMAQTHQEIDQEVEFD